MQAKVLRVLDDGRFERVGGSTTLTADVRLVAATNRKLGEMVAAGEFRPDLLYRLEIFPIELPALRERASDIAADRPPPRRRALRASQTRTLRARAGRPGAPRRRALAGQRPAARERPRARRHPRPGRTPVGGEDRAAPGPEGRRSGRDGSERCGAGRGRRALPTTNASACAGRCASPGGQADRRHGPRDELPHPAAAGGGVRPQGLPALSRVRAQRPEKKRAGDRRPLAVCGGRPYSDGGSSVPSRRRRCISAGSSYSSGPSRRRRGSRPAACIPAPGRRTSPRRSRERPGRRPGSWRSCRAGSAAS